MRKIILANGELILLEDWKKRNKNTGLAEFFSIREFPFNRKEWILHEDLFMIIDELRRRAHKHIRINSAYRTFSEQKRLLDNGNYKAAKVSPHTYGLAVDIDTVNYSETLHYVELLKKICSDAHIQYRIGYRTYHKIGQSFVHIDICPNLFCKGKVWEEYTNIPSPWKIHGLEW